MVGRVYVRDLEILEGLQGELNQFNHGANNVLSDVARSLVESREFLNSRMSYWNTELRRREDALRACLSNDEKDHNCSREDLAVREAQESLEKLRKLQIRLEQAVGEYQPQANRLQQLVNSKTNKAKGDLHRSIEKYKNYLAQSAAIGGYQSVSSTKGLKSSSTFSITNWDGYPSGPRPSGPFTVLDEDEYESARHLADSVNRRMHIENPE